MRKRRFGFVTVFEAVAGRVNGGHRLHRCRCICGTEWLARIDDLIRGRVKSCGCRGITDEAHAINESFNHYRQSARKRGIAFHLAKEEFRALVLRPCHYCGAPPRAMWLSFRKVRNSKRRPEPVLMNGVDRLNNERYYRVSNCVPCCGDCNQAKMDRPADEFRLWTLRAGTHRLMRYPIFTPYMATSFCAVPVIAKQ